MCVINSRCVPNTNSRRRRAVDVTSSVEATYEVVLNGSTTAEVAEVAVANVTTVEAVESRIANLTVASIQVGGKLFSSFSLISNIWQLSILPL